MNQQVAVVMEVDAFRRDIGGQQNTNRAVLFAERFDNVLLVGVRQPGVELLDDFTIYPQLAAEVVLQEFERGQSLGEDEQPERGESSAGP